MHKKRNHDGSNLSNGREQPEKSMSPLGEYARKCGLGRACNVASAQKPPASIMKTLRII